jgi:hypothetical protein
MGIVEDSLVCKPCGKILTARKEDLTTTAEDLKEDLTARTEDTTARKEDATSVSTQPEDDEQERRSF